MKTKSNISEPIVASQTQRALVLLQELRAVLSKATAAIISNDLVGIEQSTAWQKEICREMSVLASRARTVSQALPDFLGDEMLTAEDDIAKLRTLAVEVYQRNQIQAALLRRVQRTMRIFNRVLAVSGPTYSVPQSEAANAGSSWRR